MQKSGIKNSQKSKNDDAKILKNRTFEQGTFQYLLYLQQELNNELDEYIEKENIQHEKQIQKITSTGLSNRLKLTDIKKQVRDYKKENPVITKRHVIQTAIKNHLSETKEKS